MKQASQIINAVGDIYQWLQTELAKLNPSCCACGDCCDFEAFGHRLYVTTPELLYFCQFIKPPFKEMATGVCPYRVNGKCSVHPYRFAGCRIFSCKGMPEKENALCEQAISKFKALCDTYPIPYHYVDLKTGLQMLNKNHGFTIQH